MERRPALWTGRTLLSRILAGCFGGLLGAMCAFALRFLLGLMGAPGGRLAYLIIPVMAAVGFLRLDRAIRSLWVITAAAVLAALGVASLIGG